MDNRVRAVHGNNATSPESARASALFDQFVSAGTFKSVLSTYRQLCEVLRLKPTNISSFYPRLKAKLHSWRAASLWAKLDKRASHKCYNRGKACSNTRVLLIGAGPCGLRSAIEAQLLGAKVVVIEKRDRFSRNNVLHLWPFVIHDLRGLGAKKFFGKFCAGSIDHISIRQLQLILLKVALLLGVEVHENVGFVNLREPPEDQLQGRIGWSASVDPADHPVSQYEFDVLIGADGKRNTLLGFNRKEFRGKLAIAVTANFINRHTLEEARVEEISGVAFIFNQKFFQDMREQTGIDLENIVYYKDDTHYFVMTAKKQSLLERGVIINDYNDTARLLSAENVDREALMEYARDAAFFATNYQLPSLEFAVNHYGQADVAMFDFTSMYAAENACRVTIRRSHKLLQGLVGDSLLEPFWPTGSGCARGFLSSFDAAWMIRSWASGKLSPLQVLAEREAIYRLLAQTTPENLSKDLNQYTLNPTSRYPNLNLHAVLPSQVRSLYDTDGTLEDNIADTPVEIPKKKRRKDAVIHPDTLLNWCQRQVALYDNIKVENLTSSWKNGLALCGILQRYRPDLISLDSLNPDDVAKNNQLAFDICEKELGIPPVMTGQEMAECEVPDKLSMVSYLAQIYETFRGEIPVVCQPKSSNDDRALSPTRQSIGTPRSILTRISNKFQSRKKYSIEKELSKEKVESMKRGRHPPYVHKRRSKEKDKGIALDFVNNDVALTNFKNIPSTPDTPKESINARVRNLEMKMRKDAGLRCHLIEEMENSNKTASTRIDHTELNIKEIQAQLQRNGSGRSEKKPVGPKVGRLRKDEWNVKMLEEKIGQQQKLLQKSTPAERSKIKQEIFDNNLRLIEAKLNTGGALTAEEKAKFAEFDSNLSKLQEQLTKGNLNVGERGHNQVASMTEHMATIWDKKAHLRKDPLPPPPVINNCEPTSKVSGSEICYFCKKRVYLMERFSAEGLFFHRSCFKCEYCSGSLRLGNYAFDKDTVCGGKFYCAHHFRMPKPDHRWQEMMKRKQAFLSNVYDEEEKQRIYTTVLANAEKALSPNKQQEAQNEVSTTDSAVPSTSPTSEAVQQQEPKIALLEPLSNLGRDQTPERVEYENSILDYSEEELLTSELEEEELTQKNLGPCQELTTSDDEYSDISADSESDEEAYAEELERSLTADETRKLAERWHRKYSTEHSLMESGPSSSSSSDDVSETEIGTEDGTSDDIDSDEEYSVGHSNEDISDENPNDKDSDVRNNEVKNELTVEVPVIDLKSMNHESEDETTSDESDEFEGISDSGKLLDESSVSEDDDSTPLSDELLPPPMIPTIIIDESPPQDVDKDQEWPEDHVSECNTNRTDVQPVGGQKDEDTAIIKDVDASKTESTNEVILSDFDKIVATKHEKISCDTVSEVTSAAVLLSETDKEAVVDDAVIPDVLPGDAVCESAIGTTNKMIEQLLSKSAAIEQTNVLCDINSLGDSDVFNVLTNSQMPVCVEACDNTNIPTATAPTEDKAQLNQSGPSFTKISSPASEPQEHIRDEKTVTDAEPTLPPSEKQTIANETFALSENDQICEISPPHCHSECSADQELNISSSSDQKEDVSFNVTEELNDSLPSHISDSLPNSDANASVPPIVPTSPNKFDADHPFVTIRKKQNRTHDKDYTWDSDNSISIPWFCDPYEDFTDLNDSFPVNSPKKLFPEPEANSVLYKTANETLSKSTTEENSCDSLFASPAKCDSSPELTSYSPAFSTPLKSIEKPLIISTANNANGLLSPISENDVKSILSKHSVASKDEKKNDVNGFIPVALKEPLLNESSSKFPSSQNRESYAFSDNNHKYSSTETSLSKSSNKYSGYSGSFAEKIRPKSALGDTIYLRTLDINLQEQQFSSLTKSSDKLDSLENNTSIHKKLFHGSDKSLSQSRQKSADSDVCVKGFRRQTSVPIDTTSVPLDSLGPKVVSKSGMTSNSKHLDSSSTSLFQETYGDPVSPYTYAQSRPAVENAFPVKMRPKCDMDLSKLREKREKRKSVHENIQGLPFADEEKAATPIDSPLSPGNVFLAASPSDEALLRKMDDFELDQLQKSNLSAQEKAREEARARARLKSDEELGLSPKNYRKKYQRQLSFSSIYYDELNSDEFFDHENEDLEDDIIDGTFHAKRVQIVEAHDEISDSEQQPLDNLSTKSSVESVISNHSLVNTAEEPIEEKSTFASASCENMKPAPSSCKPLSLETSPEVVEPEMQPFQPKMNFSAKKETTVSVESIGEEEKLKSSGKKSFFSILSFGKSHAVKDKSSKNKVKETERASSLPADLGGKTPPKIKTFSNLKLSKTKEKQRQKHMSAGSQVASLDKPSSENAMLAANQEHHKEPKSISLSANQQKIVPKYEVYRNPCLRLTAIPSHVPTQNSGNGMAPKASEDSFSDTEEDTHRSSTVNKLSDGEKKEKDVSEKEKKAQRTILKVQRQQELKRLRTAQEIQRRLEELEVQQKELEQKGVEVEKALRGEDRRLPVGKENELMQEWYQLVHSKNQLVREEQELLIRLKDLELEDRHCRLQQEIRERMAQDTQKNLNQIGEERKILTEMLRIVEERDELVAMLDQLRLKEEEAEKSFNPPALSQCKMPAPCSSKS